MLHIRKKRSNKQYIHISSDNIYVCLWKTWDVEMNMKIFEKIENIYDTCTVSKGTASIPIKILN